MWPVPTILDSTDTEHFQHNTVVLDSADLEQARRVMRKQGKEGFIEPAGVI